LGDRCCDENDNLGNCYYINFSISTAAKRAWSTSKFTGSMPMLKVIDFRDEGMYLLNRFSTWVEHTTKFGFPAQELWILNPASFAVHPAIAVTP
jgi:hypothetical protein